MDQLFNIKQTAFILKVHPLTVRRYIREGKLNAIKAGGNVRVKEEDLTAFQKKFVPGENSTTLTQSKKKILNYKVFTDADPFLRLEGRAGSIDLK